VGGQSPTGDVRWGPASVGGQSPPAPSGGPGVGGRSIPTGAVRCARPSTDGDRWVPCQPSKGWPPATGVVTFGDEEARDAGAARSGGTGRRRRRGRL